MKNKAILVLLVALIAISAMCILTASVNAASPVSWQTTIHSTSSGVGDTATYTVTLTSTGTSPLGSVNITLPDATAQYKNIQNLAITQQPSSQNWTGQIQGNYILLYGSTQGLTNGQSLTFTFQAKNPLAAKSYTWVIGANENTTQTGLNAPAYTTNVTYSIAINTILAATLIFLIAAIIAFVNTALNRVLINFFIGWEQYRVMQKEMNEYRSETMAAARANDKKQMEKLKKRQSQINSMQAKMIKPQMVQLAISFVYLIVWFLVLTPYFGVTSLVYLPGIGPIPVVYWYPICSFFLGVLGSRLLGILPIEP